MSFWFQRLRTQELSLVLYRTILVGKLHFFQMQKGGAINSIAKFFVDASFAIPILCRMIKLTFYASFRDEAAVFPAAPKQLSTHLRKIRCRRKYNSGR